MVFFVYFGGSPQAIAVTVGIYLLSLLLGSLQSSVYMDYDVHAWEPTPSSDRRYPHRPPRNRPWPAPEAHGETFQVSVSFPRRACCLLAAVVCGGLAYLLLRYEGPRAAARELWEAAGDLLESANRFWRQLVEGQAQWQGGPAGQAQGERQRDRASAAEVRALPVEAFATEQELQSWSAVALKEELRRLQRAADMRLGFSGGSEARETQRLLRGGGVVEKCELVSAVRAARGGDSGQSCAVCLSSYESGDKLRVLHCGHRFHVDCVDRWLVQQSRTCPLCSKRV